MKFGIDWSQASTKRGAIWVIVAVVGLPMSWMGKDPTQLITLASGIAGGLGLMVKD
jgi:hypothetical protein